MRNRHSRAGISQRFVVMKHPRHYFLLGHDVDAAEKLTKVPKGRLKHSCFVSGHDFSRAV